MELIDKADLVVRVEKLQSEIAEEKKLHEDNSMWYNGINHGFNLTKDILDTLEVKEVKEEPSDNLEEEIDKELHENWYGEYINLDIFRESAKHFFELGLKAKGE